MNLDQVWQTGSFQLKFYISNQYERQIWARKLSKNSEFENIPIIVQFIYSEYLWHAFAQRIFLVPCFFLP